MLLLNAEEIERKIKRISYEILENNFNEEKIIIIGINQNGYSFAEKIKACLESIDDIKTILSRIQLNPLAPLSTPITCDLSLEKLQNQTVILIDDVANTGRTLFYGLKPLLEILPKKLEIAVLIDRKHKSFPVQPDYVGLSLHTTLQNNIKISFNETMEANLN